MKILRRGDDYSVIQVEEVDRLVLSRYWGGPIAWDEAIWVPLDRHPQSWVRFIEYPLHTAWVLDNMTIQKAFPGATAGSLENEFGVVSP